MTHLIEELIKLATDTHYACEDAWYTCPKHPDAIQDDERPTECNCGADEHNARVAELAKKLTHI